MNKLIIYLICFITILCILLLIYYLRRKNIDIYLLPDSEHTYIIYGEDFIDMLKKYGNVINISYPKNVFDLDKFSDNISNKINKNNRKCILVGYSIGSLICNIISSKVNNNLMGILLIAYSCDGKLTEEGNKLAQELYKKNNLKDRQNILNKLSYKGNPIIPNNIQNIMKKSILSQENQKNIGISIGKWIGNHPDGICELYKFPVFIIYGQYDITYHPPSTEICNKYNCMEIKNAGHAILVSHYDEVLKWLNNSLQKIFN